MNASESNEGAHDCQRFSEVHQQRHLVGVNISREKHSRSVESESAPSHTPNKLSRTLTPGGPCPAKATAQTATTALGENLGHVAAITYKHVNEKTVGMIDAVEVKSISTCKGSKDTKSAVCSQSDYSQICGSSAVSPPDSSIAYNKHLSWTSGYSPDNTAMQSSIPSTNPHVKLDGDCHKITYQESQIEPSLDMGYGSYESTIQSHCQELFDSSIEDTNGLPHNLESDQSIESSGGQTMDITGGPNSDPECRFEAQQQQNSLLEEQNMYGSLTEESLSASVVGRTEGYNHDKYGSCGPWGDCGLGSQRSNDEVYSHKDGELEDILLQFKNFFLNRYESAFRQFHHSMTDILDEQQNHACRIVLSAVREPGSQASGEDIADKGPDKSTVSSSPPVTYRDSGYLPVDLDGLFSSQTQLDQSSPVNSEKTKKILELMTMSCSVGTLLTKPHFKVKI